MATLIASWGGNADTSYTTVDEADEYIGSSTAIGHKVDPGLWLTASSIQKASALLAATRDIDGHFYSGERQFHDQTLEFPRVPEGDYYDSWPWISRSLTSVSTYNIYLTEQKRRVKAATAEQAFRYVKEGTDISEHLERRLQGIRSFSESIGPISESISYGGMQITLVPEAMRLLMPYRGRGPALYRS